MKFQRASPGACAACRSVPNRLVAARQNAANAAAAGPPDPSPRELIWRRLLVDPGPPPGLRPLGLWPWYRLRAMSCLIATA